MPREKLSASITNWVSAVGNRDRCEYQYTLPTILDAKCKWVPYGKLDKNIYSIWEYIQHETGIEFDLTYAPSAWRQVLWDWEDSSNKDTTSSNENSRNHDVIYLHCGGQEGNISQLKRYRRKWPALFAGEVNT
jgi:1-aminocyclopropane-1-carboxylate deaminase/D-cysteine desulfhydrase-like pyridoxal-dependent ACC family enzyme